MRRILIIADDLSGAADCAIAFAGSGLDAVVLLAGSKAEVDADVLSVDADTRGMSAEMAAEEIARLTRQYCNYDNQDQLVFKKLDSTLRGNVGAELAALVKAQRDFDLAAGRKPGRPRIAVVAPAFPAHGRTTLHGRQLLNGQPLEELEIWRRDGMAGTAHIPGLLEAAGMRTSLVGLDAVRGRDGSLGGKMVELSAMADVLVCDAETDNDLLAIAEAGVGLGHGTVWAGSAGLAYHLPKAVGHRRTSRAISPLPLASGPTLFVVGTTSPISREQVDRLASSSDVTVINIPACDLTEGTQPINWQQYEQSFWKALASGRDVVAVLGAEPGNTEADGAQKLDKTRGKALCSALARIVEPLAGGVGALVATGGETARAVLQAWNVSALRLVGELEPGVPFSVTENWSRRLPVLTKAGDFGNPQTLLHCQNFLRDLNRVSGGTLSLEKGL